MNRLARTTRKSAPHPRSARGDGRTDTSLAASAYERIKSDIITSELAPHSYHTESELAARYHLGKTPVRFALALLNSEGLVRVLPRRGIQIVEVTLGDLKDTYALRVLLEPYAASLAATRRTAADVERLRALLSTEQGDGHRELQRSQIEAHSRLHVEVAHASGVKQLARLIQTLHETMERLLSSNPSVGSYMKFGDLDDELLAAIERRDAEAAAEVTRRGITVSAELITRAVLGTDAPGQVSADADSLTSSRSTGTKERREHVRVRPARR